MTDETKNITESAAANSATKPRRAKKPSGAIPVGSVMSIPPQLRRVDPAEPEPTGRQEVSEARLRASRNRNKTARQNNDDSKTVPPRASTKGPSKETKSAIALKALHRKRGASIAELQEITGWQPHSVRGFLSGTVKKKLGLLVVSEVGKDDVRRYRINEAEQTRSAKQAG